MVFDNELVVIIFRGTDRLLITIGGVISIWLGYKLFSKALPNNGTFDGGIGSWSVRMQNIAPGVFFALFGASALIFSISHPLSYEKKANVGSQSTPVVPPVTQKVTPSSSDVPIANNVSKGPVFNTQIDTRFSGFTTYNAPDLDTKAELDILNSLVIINNYRKRPADSFTNEQIQKFNSSFDRLYYFQIYLTNKLFGQGSYDKYLRIAAYVRNDPEKLNAIPVEDKILYENLKSLYEQ